MERNFVHSFLVYLCFGLCDAGEYGERPLFCSRADAGLLYECANVFPCTMMMMRVIVVVGVRLVMMMLVRIVMVVDVRLIIMVFMRVVMMMGVRLIIMVFMRVIMMMGVGLVVMMLMHVVMVMRVRLIMMMLMRVIMRDVIGLPVQLNHSVHATDATTFVALKVQTPAIYAEFAQFTP
jgi:hypothetical protein